MRSNILSTLLFVTAMTLSGCGGGGSDGNTETVNQAPTADAGTDKTVQVNNSISITGSGSDTDGTIVGYEWKKGSTVLSTSATFTYTPTSVGTDTLILTVIDNDGATDSDTMDVTVTTELNQAPTANAGIDKTVQVNNSISITGSGSDTDGTIVGYEWKKGSTVLSTSATFTYTPTSVGTDTLILTVIDNDGATDSDTMDVTVTEVPMNQAPTADAGTDKTVQVNNSISITGNGSDTDGTIVGYQWREGSTVLANSATFNYTPTTTGIHIFTLTVTDNEGATDSDTMNITVTVPNNTPTANAGTDKTIEVNQPISITGSGSDSDGTISSYQWREGSTVLANSATFNYTPTTTGIHTLTLTVTDNLGATGSDRMNVNVPNLIPTANAGINRVAQVNQTITIAGSGSDIGGIISSYQWREGSTVLANSATFNYTPTTTGIHTLTLSVTDNEGATGSDTMNVDVVEATNQAPTADAGTDKTVTVNHTISITGSGSDTDGTIVGYEWREGSTILANSATFNYTPATTGIHTLTLTVNDNEGATGSDTMNVDVAENQAPTANAGTDKTIEVNQLISIIGSGSDSDGTIISYQWREGSTVLANSATFNYTPTTTGIHTLTLTVTDNDGATGSDTMNVNVTAANVISITNDYQVESLGNSSTINTTISIDTPISKSLYLVLSNYADVSGSSTITHNAKVIEGAQSKSIISTSTAKVPVILHAPQYVQDFSTQIESLLLKTDSTQPQAKIIAPIERNEDNVGEERSFCVEIKSNNDCTIDGYTTATLRKVNSNIATAYGTKTLNVWVSNNSFDSGSGCSKSRCVTQNMIDGLANTFLSSGSDNDIYDWVTNIFKEEWGSDAEARYSNLIGDSNEITILMTDIDEDDSPSGGVIGFFWSKDNFDATSVGASNERIMFYADAVMFANTDNGDYWQKEMYSTLAHEFQHMIGFYQKYILIGASTDTWITEMLSESTEDLVATKIQHIGPRAVTYTDGSAGPTNNTHGRYPLFNQNNTLSLTTWNNQLADYSKVSAFGAYLIRNYGGAQLLHDIMHNSYANEQAVVDAVNKSPDGSEKTFNNLLSEWGTAVILSDHDNLIDTPFYNTGDFTYSSKSSITYEMGSINFFNYSPQPKIYTTAGTVQAQGNYYYKIGDNITGDVTIDLQLNGQTEVTLIAK